MAKMMTNHVHLLLTPEKVESAGLMMKHLGLRGARPIAACSGRTSMTRGVAGRPVENEAEKDQRQGELF